VPTRLIGLLDVAMLVIGIVLIRTERVDPDELSPPEPLG